MFQGDPCNVLKELYGRKEEEGGRERKGKIERKRKKEFSKEAAVLLKLIEPPGSEILIIFLLPKLGLISHEWDLSLAK